MTEGRVVGTWAPSPAPRRERYYTDGESVEIVPDEPLAGSDLLADYARSHQEQHNEIHTLLGALVDHVDEIDAKLGQIKKPERWPEAMPARIACRYLAIGLTKFDELVREGVLSPHDDLSTRVSRRMFTRRHLDSYLYEHDSAVGEQESH